MRLADYALSDMELVRTAYDFGVPLHSGRFEIDGSPFGCHGLGTASVMVQIGAPGTWIAAAVLHNCYVTGDWGDGRRPGAHSSRRSRLRAQLGAAVDDAIVGLAAIRTNGVLRDALASPDRVAPADRWPVLLELADVLDKWEDGRVIYSADGRADRGYIEGGEDAVIALAISLGSPALATALRAAFDLVRAEEIAPSLTLGRRYSVVVPAPSWRMRPTVTLRRMTNAILLRLRRAGEG